LFGNNFIGVGENKLIPSFNKNRDKVKGSVAKLLFEVVSDTPFS
jgi:hypothetical protein